MQEISTTQLLGLRLRSSGQWQLGRDLLLRDVELISYKFGQRWIFRVPASTGTELVLDVMAKASGPSQPLLLGPVLSLQKCTENSVWVVSALVAYCKSFLLDPKLIYEVQGQREQLEPQDLSDLAPYHNVSLWRWELCVPLGDHEQTITYRIDGINKALSFTVPPRHHVPHMSYSCAAAIDRLRNIPSNYFSPSRLHFMSSQIGLEHKRRKIHVHIRGGGQISGKAVWAVTPQLQRFITACQQDPSSSKRLPFTKEMEIAANKFYFDSYLYQWSQREMKPLLASVPAVDMWSEADIFSGFGSMDSQLQSCEVVQGLFRASRLCFQLFQLHLNSASKIVDRDVSFETDRFLRYGPFHTNTLRDNFSYGLVIDRIAILVLDVMYERNHHEIMSNQTRCKIVQWLHDLPVETNLLFISSPIPLIFPSQLLTTAAANKLEVGYQGAQGELKTDECVQTSSVCEWVDPAHIEERNELLLHAMAVAAQKDLRLVLLSGRTGYGSHGLAVHRGGRRNSAIVHQWTASSVVDPALDLVNGVTITGGSQSSVEPPTHVSTTARSEVQLTEVVKPQDDGGQQGSDSLSQPQRRSSRAHRKKSFNTLEAVGPSVSTSMLDFVTLDNAESDLYKPPAKAHAAGTIKEVLPHRNFLVIAAAKHGGVKGSWLVESHKQKGPIKAYSCRVMAPGSISSSELRGAQSTGTRCHAPCSLL
eukprot:GILJ01014259.1.p1 GENE.GILJ01014259.1~~GILJ01014259.1.p1  ORF type:complete len:803 (-),score=92.87 GILJ01014259.1:17-2125(-)